MPNDARERTEWKVRIADWIDGLPTLIKRPVRKLMAETVIGILTSGSLRQSEIARALKEPTRLHHTQKRLSRMLARVRSTTEGGYRSENHDLLSVMGEVQRHLGYRPLWVIDRGGDRGRLWEQWLADDWPVLVRAANRRYWHWRGRQKTAQQIARELPLKHRGRLRRGRDKEVPFGQLAQTSGQAAVDGDRPARQA